MPCIAYYMHYTDTQITQNYESHKYTNVRIMNYTNIWVAQAQNYELHKYTNRRGLWITLFHVSHYSMYHNIACISLFHLSYISQIPCIIQFTNSIYHTIYKFYISYNPSNSRIQKFHVFHKIHVSHYHTITISHVCYYYMKLTIT